MLFQSNTKVSVSYLRPFLATAQEFIGGLGGDKPFLGKRHSQKGSIAIRRNFIIVVKAIYKSSEKCLVEFNF